MRVLIYGGSFNPPHVGHIRSVRTAADALMPDVTLLIPAAVPPHKQLAEGTPEPGHRLAMAKLAAEAIPGCEASDMELRTLSADQCQTMEAGTKFYRHHSPHCLQKYSG